MPQQTVPGAGWETHATAGQEAGATNSMTRLREMLLGFHKGDNTASNSQMPEAELVYRCAKL
jgi:hypothetical protein